MSQELNDNIRSWQGDQAGPKIVKRIFGLGNLSSEKIKEGQSETPDYFLKHSEGNVAVYEVKGCTDTVHPDEEMSFEELEQYGYRQDRLEKFYNKNQLTQTEKKELEDLQEQERNDANSIQEESIRLQKSYRSKIERHLDKAEKQLLKYQCYDLPLIFALVSFDMSDSVDLREFLEEQRKLGYEPMRTIDLCLYVQVHEPIFQAEKFSINNITVFFNERGEDFSKQYLSFLRDLRCPLVFNFSGEAY